MAKANGNLTVFGAETEFEGTLEFTDNLVITGKFSGTIRATGSLEVDKSAICKVDCMEARSVVVSGQVKGDIIGSERVELCNGSRVSGNVSTARLRIADNVDFDGAVTMINKVPEEDIFSVASSDYKKALIMKTMEIH